MVHRKEVGGLFVSYNLQNEREASPFQPTLHLAVIIDEKVTTSDSCFVRSELVLLFFYITPNAISSYGIGSLNQ